MQSPVSIFIFTPFHLHIAGPDSTIADLTDFICAAQMSKAADALIAEDKVIFWPFFQNSTNLANSLVE